jgi:hypothetical protein
MMARHFVYILLIIFLIITGSAFGQDPEGGLDSVYVVCQRNTTHGSDTLEVSFQIRYSSDNTGTNKIAGIGLPVLITGSNIVSVDTSDVKAFTGSGVGHFAVLAANKYGNADPTVPPFYMIYGAVNTGTGVTGDSLFVNIVLQVDDTGTICIDTLSTPSLYPSFVTESAISFTPGWNGPYCCRVDSALPGDVNCSGYINLADLVTLVQHFALCPSWNLCDPCQANLDGDSLLDWADLWHLVYYLFIFGDPPFLCNTAPYPQIDPGLPDTLKIETVDACQDLSFALDVSLRNDDSVYFHIPLAFSEPSQVVYDSFANIRINLNSIAVRAPYQCRGDSGILVTTPEPMTPTMPNRISPGAGSIIRIFGHIPPAAETGFVALDTAFLEKDNRLSLIWVDTGSVNVRRTKRFVPKVVPGGVNIRPCLAKPGDANRSNNFSLSDIIATVNYIFNKPIPDTLSPPFPPCPSKEPICWLSQLLCRGDCNGDGSVSLSDVIRGVNYIFKKPCAKPEDPTPQCWAPVKTCPCCIDL